MLTVGHSNHAIGELLGLLGGAGVTLVADVRSQPYSRRYPQFSREALARSLAAHGIDYRHFPALGGKQLTTSYEQHMATLQFREALAELIACPGVVAVMCAEADPSHCHRRHIASAAVARGTAVTHLLPGGLLRPHHAQAALFEGC
ncbi:MAG: DUF488 domain-containing protein [Bryobacterales bacterium]|nr:DUF488 domain-containing protein [Bryobacterales bacterium]